MKEGGLKASEQRDVTDFAHYVDNNSTPTMFSNLLERKYFLALYPS